MRGPLSRASARQVWLIRASVHMIRKWERAIPHQSVHRPSFYDVPDVAGISELAWISERFNVAMGRALARLRDRDDYDVIEYNIALEDLRRKHPAAYEVHQLRVALIDGTLHAAKFESSLSRLEAVLQR